MFEILKYSFFQYAIFAGILISLISSILGVFIVMRKEANITHSISNFLFLGIAISFLMNGNYYLYAFIFGIIGSFLLFFIERTKFITNEASKEIMSQAGLAGAIFAVGFLDSLTLDINNLLFGSILFVDTKDLIILGVLLVFIIFLFIFFGRNFLTVILNEDIARSLGVKVSIYNFLFLFILSIFIALSIKMFGIMLIGAFLVIPANISKILSKNLKNVFIFSLIFSIFSTIFGLFASYFLGTGAGSCIVLTLIIIFFITVGIKKYFLTN